jgi:hypothetical protein
MRLISIGVRNKKQRLEVVRGGHCIYQLVFCTRNESNQPVRIERSAGSHTAVSWVSREILKWNPGHCRYITDMH